VVTRVCTVNPAMERLKRAAVAWVCACVAACSNGTAQPPSSSNGEARGASPFDAAAPPGNADSSSGAAPVSRDAGSLPPPVPEASAPVSDTGGASPQGGSAGATDGSVFGSPDASLDGAAPMPWLTYNYAPSTRTVLPVAAIAHGKATGVDGGALFGQPIRLTGAGAGVTFDFGREVGGIVSVQFGSASDAAQAVGLAFCESSQYIGPASDLSTGGTGVIDGALAVTVTPASTYTMPANKLRGGFRYLSIYLDSGGFAEVNGVSLDFTAAPTMPALNQYPNYFYSNDDLLNRIWYAGAYTVEIDTIDPKQGRAWPAPASGWDNGATIGTGNTILVDGAKRDRTVWLGDIGIALPTAYVSTGDLVSTKNSLDTIYAAQDPTTGLFPRSGPPLDGGNILSDTYHLWTLVGAYNYYLYSGDKAWLDTNWAAHKKAILYATAKIDNNSLLDVTLPRDWGRLGQGGENIAANALLYKVLVSSAELATAEGDAAISTSYAATAASLKTAANSLLWDAAAGAYRDNPTSTVHPQDGNSLAIWFGLVDTDAKATTITATLKKNWNAYGSRTPEGDPTKALISPFPGSMEVAARFVANDDQSAFDLMRLEWGYMLNASTGTASTFWEGYLDDGSFGYGGSYMSAAHGWSTGPTFAMTQWVLGVAPDSAAGKTYHVIPHVGDLTHAEGSLAMAPGQVVAVSFDHAACGDFTERVDSSTNVGTVGVLGVPKFGQSRVVRLNGTTIWDGTQLAAGAPAQSADEDANFVYFRGMPPNKGVFTFYPQPCP
jgi:hypothetical protein